ncbi:MAG TPA: delta-60 repeat domain-containing protein, partial [Pyrinomonadaceae bacterium]|nr:delta-60 repeat domain-containing protein [Pyrinomonadaceae bacterium]
MKTFRPLIRQRMLSAHTWRTSLNGICLLVTMMLAPITGSAAGGDIDPSFNPGAGASGSTATVLAVAVQTDGKIVVGGTFSQAAGQARGNIARFNPDGSLDPTFLSSGVGANGDVSALFVQPDGKIVICGDFTTVNGSARNRIARLNSDGTLDFTFLATGSGANFVVNAAALQSDGKIVIGGRFTTINGTTRNHIARINSDGTLDASFLAAGSGINGDVFSLALQTDGKTLIGGFFTSVNGTARNGIARLNSDGTNDAS